MYLSIYLSVCLSVCLSTCLSASLKTKLFCETSSSFELDNIRNGAILRDFLNVWTWERQKRSNSARLLHFSKLTTSKQSNSARRPQFLNLTTSKMKQFRETSSCFKSNSTTSKTKQFCQNSSFFKLDNIKNDARSYEVLHLSRKIILANLQIWCSKMQPFSGNERPDLLTSLMNMSLVLRLPRKMHLCRSSSKVPCLPSFLELLQNPQVLLTFDKIDNPLHLPRGTTSQHPKVVRTPGVFNILTSKCASRHNDVHFFDISTSKSGVT